jgi:hypothetical protein
VVIDGIATSTKCFVGSTSRLTFLSGARKSNVRFTNPSENRP